MVNIGQVLRRNYKVTLSMLLLHTDDSMQSVQNCRYWLHERVTWKSLSWIFFSRGDNFPCYPLVQSIIIVLYWMLHVIIKYIVYSNVWFQNNPGLINIWVCISNNKHMRINSEKLVDIFLEYHLLSNNITHCQVSLRARATNGKIGRVDLSENENCLVYI